VCRLVAFSCRQKPPRTERLGQIPRSKPLGRTYVQLFMVSRYVRDRPIVYFGFRFHLITDVMSSPTEGTREPKFMAKGVVMGK